MRYSSELRTLINSMSTPPSRGDLINKLRELSFCDSQGFTRRWITDLIIELDKTSDEEFESLLEEEADE